jgi:predicted metal-binding membrane protein
LSVPGTSLEAVLRRDRLLILGGVLGAAAIAWAWLVIASRDMYGEMTGAAAWMMVADWDARYFLLIFAMWAVMMLGMMLPSAAPTLLLYGMTVRNSGQSPSPIARVYAFAAGYLLVWSGFSLLATTLQWALSQVALLNPMMESSSAWLGGAVLIAAGVYQWTPLKRGCLAQCRGPLAFITGHWRPGLRGALRMGLGHGLFCLGCCWVLMLLLFVGGVMNLTWIAAITLFVLVEKLAPLGAQGGRLSGALLVLAGVVFLLQG